MQRLAEDAVEQQPGRAGLVRSAYLAEDLALARHERIEPRCHAKEMQRGRMVAQAVERRLHLRLELSERSDRGLLRRVDVRRSDVQLGAVARREAHRLAADGCEPRRELRAVLAVERDPLAQLDGRVVVRGADEDEADHPK